MTVRVEAIAIELKWGSMTKNYTKRNRFGVIICAVTRRRYSFHEIVWS